MFSPAITRSFFVLLFDTLLAVTVVFLGVLLSEIILPGFIASKIRLFDMTIILSSLIFLLYWISQKVEIAKSKNSQDGLIHKAFMVIIGLVGLAAFASAAYTYHTGEMVVLFFSTLFVLFLFYKIYLYNEPV